MLGEWKRLSKPMELKTGRLFMLVRIGDIFEALSFQMRLGQFQSVDNRKMSQGQSLCWPSFLYAQVSLPPNFLPFSPAAIME